MENDSIFLAALDLIFSGSGFLYQIIGLSLLVSMTATMFACFVGVPFGIALALYKFYGRGLLIIILNAGMAAPPVVIGLFVYIMLSRSGPLGAFGLLFTPAAMIIAQLIMVLPIVISLSHRQGMTLVNEYQDFFCSISLKGISALLTLIYEGRYQLITVFLSAFGRAISEVGAVMIVGGNIANATRVMTGTIALETSKGNITLALALGVALIMIAIVISFLSHYVNTRMASKIL